MKPWAHQQKEFDEHRASPARSLWWAMRTGKTRAIIDKACWLKQQDLIDGVMVVAPNGVHRNWVLKEIPKHIWPDVHNVYVAWQTTDLQNDERMRRLLHAMAYNSIGLGPDDPLFWLTVNMESLIRDDFKEVMDHFYSRRRIMTVFDESHHFAVPKTKRTAVARGMARASAYRINLSGTPAENTPLKCYTQYELMDKGALGHQTYGTFKEEFANWGLGYLGGGRSYPKVESFKNLDVLKQRMAPYTSVVLKSDCHDLPPVLKVERTIELTEEQKAWWKRTKEKELDWALEKGIFDGGALFVKLQQIEGGYWIEPKIEGEHKRVTEIIPPHLNPKMLALYEECSQHNVKVVAWFAFTHEIEEAAKFLRSQHIRCGVIHGGIPQVKREDVLKAFREGRLDAVLAQPKTIGEGFEVPADVINWYSQTPDAVVRSQANERATVMGGKHVDLVDFVAPGGVDERYLGLVEGKIEVAEDVSRSGLRKVLEQMSV